MKQIIAGFFMLVLAGIAAMVMFCSGGILDVPDYNLLGPNCIENAHQRGLQFGKEYERIFLKHCGKPVFFVVVPANKTYGRGMILSVVFRDEEARAVFLKMFEITLATKKKIAEKNQRINEAIFRRSQEYGVEACFFVLQDRTETPLRIFELVPVAGKENSETKELKKTWENKAYRIYRDDSARELAI